MEKVSLSYSLKIIFPIISTSIAILSFTGTILKNDEAGRIVFGICWSAITIGWIIYLLKIR